MRAVRSCPSSKLLALLLSAVSAAILLSGCKRVGLAPGENAPDLKLRMLEGQPLSLADFRSKVVLLNFWATWCAPCIQEMPDLQKLQETFKEKDFTVLAVAVDDDIEQVTQFRINKGLTFPIALAKGDDVRQFKITGFPETLLLDKAGKILLFIDPATGSPTNRVIGPREWGGVQAISSVEQLLK